MSNLEKRILAMIRSILEEAMAKDYPTYEVKEKLPLVLDLMSLLIGKEEEEQKGEENNG